MICAVRLATIDKERNPRFPMICAVCLILEKQLKRRKAAQKGLGADRGTDCEMRRKIAKVVAAGEDGKVFHHCLVADDFMLRVIFENWYCSGQGGRHKKWKGNGIHVDI